MNALTRLKICLFITVILSSLVFGVRDCATSEKTKESAYGTKDNTHKAVKKTIDAKAADLNSLFTNSQKVGILPFACITGDSDKQLDEMKLHLKQEIDNYLVKKQESRPSKIRTPAYFVVEKGHK